MPYEHFGKIGDIWKHLPLCEILKIESPRKYIESNSAYPFYHLKNTKEQNYGIYFFFNNQDKSDILRKSTYCQLLRNINQNQDYISYYLGSPGFAMNILKDISEEFIFYDIDKDAIDELHKYAKKLHISNKTKIYFKDSINGLNSEISNFNLRDLIHFDPYLLFEKNSEGISYFDLFIRSTLKKVKNVLWYGFFVENQKKELLDKISKKLNSFEINTQNYNIQNMIINLKIMQKNSVLVNPGVLGCGLIVSNLSDKSIMIMKKQKSELEKIYQKSIFQNHSGRLDGEIINY